ncbi:MAG: M20/M25/M40 family metallo-hydrolase [Pseudomonadota bacterium]
MDGTHSGRISRLAAAVLLALALLLPGLGIHAFERPDAQIQSLAELAVDPMPWMHIEAYSEQRQPVYLGATPREMELCLPPVDRGRPLLPRFLKPLGEAQAKAIRAALIKIKLVSPGIEIEFEAWPVRDNAGRLTWTFTRFRIPADPGSPWRWLDASQLQARGRERMPAPLLPARLDPADPIEFALIFSDFFDLPGLYDKPAFGDCVWTPKADDAPLPPGTPAWLPTDLMASIREKRNIPGGVCRQTPPPARLNGRPTAFVLSLSHKGLVWPAEIDWKKTHNELPPLPGRRAFIKAWPPDFTMSYQQDMLAMDGEAEAVFPLSGRRVWFKAKSGADPDNQLGLLIEYLEERYRVLEIETRPHDFIWRGLPQANLIAVIPGTLPAGLNRPVLMGDHIDTAFCEDEYDRTGLRISAPGADDNVSATAALLRAAVILKDSKPLHDIWLVHLTGEEFPPDDLGAREFLSRLMKAKQDITGLVLMDLIGWRTGKDEIFQVNPGDSQPSMTIAAEAFDAARSLNIKFTPRLRSRFNSRSYLYNTDGLLFSDAGYPVILFNEHMNRLKNMNRVGYHHTSDTSRKIDWEYVTAVVKTAIETVARLSRTPPPVSK